MDREQTHKSIRSNMIEEVYEYLEAVDADDVDGMREELGDLLMQVVFHARMAQEAGRFDLQDVIDEVVDKLIRRHPHVFGDTHVDNSDDVLVNWEAIKSRKNRSASMYWTAYLRDCRRCCVPISCRARLPRSALTGRTAHPYGLRYRRSWASCRRLCMQAIRLLPSELGDVLFAVVNYARHNGIEPEVALDGTNNRFASRFNYVEEQVEASGKTWQDFTLNELDEFWNQAKELERKSDL